MELLYKTQGVCAYICVYVNALAVLAVTSHCTKIYQFMYLSNCCDPGSSFTVHTGIHMGKTNRLNACLYVCATTAEFS